MNVLFISIVVLTALNIFRGWHRGIIGMIYGTCAWVFIGLFVLLVNPLLYNYMVNDEGIHDRVYNKVYPYVDRRVPGYMEDESDTGMVCNLIRSSSGVELPGEIKEKLESGELEIPEEYKELLKNIDLSEYKDIIEQLDTDTINEVLENNGKNVLDIINELRKSEGEDTAAIREAVVESAAKKATRYVLKFIAIAMAYLIAKIIAIIVKIILDTFLEHGIAGRIIHIAGAGFGAVESIFYIWVIMYGISVIRILDFGQTLYGYAQDNPMLKLLYENNGLEYFLSKL